MIPLETVADAVVPAFDWNAMVTPAFALLGALGGALLTSTLGGRQRREEREHELAVLNDQRAAEEVDNQTQRRRDAYLGLIRAIHETTQRNNEHQHPPVSEWSTQRIFDYNDLVLAAGVVQMAVPEAEGNMVQSIVKDFIQRHFRDPSLARNDVLRIYRDNTPASA